ncbi:PQQ-dependent sugar dehydrogenase [Limimaricola variabilis]|uniref:PQQ-dependent sugar dehydrogenase n=1 Tax=Limimaricola variabilis TaxID=1492771 RepID=UPI002AC93A46|nr:PQQ-dependent sugar dehydrogenase [Limimaricola variabilis]WPY93586.1 PQQ-dependent sugar dehydrogenase [Limimaricola variabilis]
MKTTSPFVVAAIAAVIPGLALAQSDNGNARQPVDRGPANADYQPAFPEQARAPKLEATEVAIETFAEGLERPWGIAPLPGGGYLVTERPGRLRHVSPEGEVHGPISGLPEIDARKQGGLLDVTLSPDFAADRMVYFTYAKPVDGGVATAAARGTLSDDMTALENVEDIFVQGPPSDAPMHYGSRITFDGEGHVFITTGEHFTDKNRQLAQELDNTYGKVVRLNPDGTVPEDNPFVGQEGEDAIWSYGHRNIQGAAIQPATGDYWTIEHGPAGGDELNRPTPGANYGWPKVSYGIRYDGDSVGIGEPRAEGIEEPVYYWDPVIAPGGMAFYEGNAFEGWAGDLVIASLNPGEVVRLDIDEEGRVVGEEALAGGNGRVRDVEIAEDGSVLFLIDSEAGAILRMSPKG